MDDVADVLVVGSGCSGAMAAQTLVEAGVRTTMVCAGVKPAGALEIPPQQDFTSLRQSDPNQHAYLLGNPVEGVPWGPLGAGAQLTPPRRHLMAHVQRLLPWVSSTFQPTESLAYGGLGGGWGLGCCVYSPKEMEAAGLDARQMQRSYARVAARVGVSGMQDDAAAFTHAGLEGVQPAPDMDPTGQRLLENYARERASLNGQGFHAGRTALALLTQPLGDRQPYAYRDLDFHSDAERSAYRPWMTADALQKQPNFRFEGGWLVQRFEEDVDGVTVHALHVETLERRAFRARTLMLAAGVLGTARVVLRTLGAAAQLPILSNAYAYVPCIQPALLGAHGRERSVGFSQVSLFHDAAGDGANVAMASIYSYRSLMLYRLAKETPVGLADAWLLLRYMMPALTIMGLHHPEDAAHAGRLCLEADGGSPTQDHLRVDYPVASARKAALKQRGRLFKRALRSMGSHALKEVAPPRGASIHYAGTLPMDGSDKPFSLHANGRLAGTAHVYVADASGFRFLPAKGPTLSLMAFADLVARAWVERRG